MAETEAKWLTISETSAPSKFHLPEPPQVSILGLVMITAVIVAWLVEIARGHSGNPYGWLGALGGVAYTLAVAFFRWRG